MYSVFADTSALVKYYYPEVGSETVEEIFLKAEKIYLCQLVTTEFASALMKKVRTKTLEMGTQERIWEVFMDDLSSGQMEVIGLDDRHFKKATSIIRRYGQKQETRTLDSLQLAAALDVLEARFVTADKALSALAAKAGLRVEEL
ncbi:MAG: type II toxin-antitoxin system VapC family toxin [Thermodesulfobacteriota bacterium]